MQKPIEKSANWLLIANSILPSESLLLTLAKDKRIMVLDGAYAAAARMKLTFDVLLGDFDSISADELTQAKKTPITVMHTPNQNQTDLEKGIAYLDRLNARSITICAATEGRLQHTLFNLHLLKRCYRPDRALILYTPNEIIRYVQNTEILINGNINDSIGIFGFPQAFITTTGLRYEVCHYLLDFAYTSSISNALARKQAYVKVTGDALVIHEMNVSFFCNQFYENRNEDTALFFGTTTSPEEAL
jgi:thiamine pyrophosphokinase